MTKTRRKRQIEFPVDPSIIGHAPMTVSEMPFEPLGLEPLSMETPTVMSKEECRMKIRKLSDQHRALTDYAAQIKTLGESIMAYHKRTYGPLDGDFTPSETEKCDGRSIENPYKNLKISARGIFRWAKYYGQSATEALQEARTKIDQIARTVYQMTAIPEDLIVYMNDLYTNYSDIKPPVFKKKSKINLDSVPEPILPNEQA